MGQIARIDRVEIWKHADPIAGLSQSLVAVTLLGQSQRLVVGGSVDRDALGRFPHGGNDRLLEHCGVDVRCGENDVLELLPFRQCQVLDRARQELSNALSA